MSKPKPKLTQLTVERQGYDPDWGTPSEIPDYLYPALRLVIQPTGKKSFAVRTRFDGKTAKLTLKDVGLDLKSAREATRKILADGRDPREAKRKIQATTFKGVAELYLKDSAGHVRPKTQVERERHLRRDWAPLHHKPLPEIRKADVAARLLELKDEHGAIAANRSRTTLHNMMEWAVDQDLIEANVVASTRRPLRREPTRDRVLTPDERRAVWATTEGDGDYNAIVRLLLLTGQRREEVAGMRWGELDLEGALWSLPGSRTKNGLPHLVPLSRPAVEIIKVQDRQEGRDYVFGEGEGPFSGWSRSKARLDKRCGVTGWTLHDIRRSVSTAMNDELGIAPHVVEAVINHISGEAKRGVAGTYNRAQYLKERTAALQAWADHLTSDPARKVVPFPAVS